jgi:hypothetical protein
MARGETAACADGHNQGKNEMAPLEQGKRHDQVDHNVAPAAAMPSVIAARF